jgi:hypothetical protein
MYITSSRNGSLTVKRFSSYLSKLLFDLKFIPRGKTDLNKLFEKAAYLGHTHFLVCSSQNSRNQVSLLIYKKKLDGNSYLPDKEYIIELDNLSHKISLKGISKKKAIADKNNLFYFLDNKHKTKSEKSDYSIVATEDKAGSNYKFVVDGKDIGVNFILLGVIEYDKLYS